jgi:type I restriction enzyme R subunit
VAFDVSLHFQQNFQGDAFKGATRCPGQGDSAALQEVPGRVRHGSIRGADLGADVREGGERCVRGDADPLIRFWKAMKGQVRPKAYNRQLITPSNTVTAGGPEIIVVCRQAPDGFRRAPSNTVLYLTRNLRDHTLLQAIARVNRLHDGKEFGYIIDYGGVGEPRPRARLVQQPAEFDRAIRQPVTDVRGIIATLPQKHSVLWDVFSPACVNRRDPEEYERLLADDALACPVSMTVLRFQHDPGGGHVHGDIPGDTPERTVEQYTKDLRFFKETAPRCAPAICRGRGFLEYEPRHPEAYRPHVGTGEVNRSWRR